MKLRHWFGLGTIVAGSILGQSQAHATSNFSDLRSELVDRAVVLTNSVDKNEQKQGKACVKAIATLDKSEDLEGDIKAGSKVAKSLAKAFPFEFNSPTLSPFAVTNLNTLVTLGYSNMIDEVQSILDDLQTSINALSGTPQTQAQNLLNAALIALNSASGTNFATASKLLASSLKSAASAQKIVNSNTGGGGGACGTIAISTVTMTVQSVAWITTMNPPTSFAGGEYLVSTGFFNVGGTAADGSALGLSVDSGVNGPGTYALATSSTYTVGSPPTQTFNVTSGTITITGLDVVNWTACGTATFSATDGVTPITVNDVAFEIKDLGHE